MIKIGNRIAQLRRNNNMTQEQFAQMLGVSISTVSKIERGKQLPGNLVLLICQKIGVSSDYIFFGRSEALNNIELFYDYDPVELQILLDCLKRLMEVIDTSDGNDVIMKEIMRQCITA